MPARRRIAGRRAGERRSGPRGSPYRLVSCGEYHCLCSGFRLVGDLTVHGVTRPVALDVEYHGWTTDPWGGRRAGFSASAEVDREDFGLTWNAALEGGGVLVGKKARLEFEIEAVKQA